MPVRGRKPKPSAVKEAAGNPGGRPLNENEPKPPAGDLVPPPWVNGDTLLVWNALVPVMRAMGVASLADVQAIGRYCDGVVLWQRARDFLHKNGSTFPLRARESVAKLDANGKETGREYPVVGVAQFPQVAEYRQLSKLLLAFEAEFGLTASSRTRIEVRAVATVDSELDAKKRDFFKSKGERGQAKVG